MVRLPKRRRLRALEAAGSDKRDAERQCARPELWVIVWDSWRKMQLSTSLVILAVDVGVRGGGDQMAQALMNRGECAV